MIEPMIRHIERMEDLESVKRLWVACAKRYKQIAERKAQSFQPGQIVRFKKGVGQYDGKLAEVVRANKKTVTVIMARGVTVHRIRVSPAYIKREEIF
jgi:hypothetical protein